MQLGLLPLRFGVGRESVIGLGAGVRWGWSHMWQVSGLVRLAVGKADATAPSYYLQAGPLLMRHQAGLEVETGVDVMFAAVYARALWEPNDDGSRSWTCVLGVRVSLAAVVGAVVLMSAMADVMGAFFGWLLP